MERGPADDRPRRFILDDASPVRALLIVAALVLLASCSIGAIIEVNVGAQASHEVREAPPAEEWVWVRWGCGWRRVKVEHI